MEEFDPIVYLQKKEGIIEYNGGFSHRLIVGGLETYVSASEGFIQARARQEGRKDFGISPYIEGKFAEATILCNYISDIMVEKYKGIEHRLDSFELDSKYVDGNCSGSWLNDDFKKLGVKEKEELFDRLYGVAVQYLKTLQTEGFNKLSRDFKMIKKLRDNYSNFKFQHQNLRKERKFVKERLSL